MSSHHLVRQYHTTGCADTAPHLPEPVRPRRCSTGTVEDRPPTEDELVARAKRGELAAYGEIVRRHQSIAFRTAWVITGNAADAEEAAQDAFVKAHAALGRFRDGAPFRPWLLAIVSNEARNRLKSAGRRERLALRVAEERRPGGAVPSPEAALLDSEQRDELLAALAGALRDRPRGDRLPLLPRAVRGGDGGRPGVPPRHRQVPNLARPGAPARPDGAGRCVTSSRR